VPLQSRETLREKNKKTRNSSAAVDRINDASQWEVVGVSSIDGSTFLDVRRCESKQATFSSLRKFANGRFVKVVSQDDMLNEKDEVIYYNRDYTSFVAEIAKVD
jgi:hypothetical protein